VCRIDHDFEDILPIHSSDMNNASSQMTIKKIFTSRALLPISCIFILYWNMPAIGLRNALTPTAFDTIKQVSLACAWTFYVYGVGAFIMDNFKREKQQNISLPSVMFVGFTVLTISVYALSCFALFKASIVFPLFCVTTLAVCKWQNEFATRLAKGFQDAWQRLASSSPVTKVVMAFTYLSTFFIIIFILIFKVIYPDFGGDIFCYYRYYHMVVNQASIIPKAFDGWVYFPAKGSGLHSLCALLTGDQSLPVASLVYYVFFVFLAASLMSLVTTKRYWCYILVAALSLNMEMVIFTNNFSKTNFYAAIHPFFLLYMLLLISKNNTSKASYAVIVSYCISSAFFTVQTSAFSFLLLIALAYPLRGVGSGMYKAMLTCAFGLLFFSAILSIANIFQVSFADLSTVIPQMKATLYKESTYLSCKVEFDTLYTMTLMQAGNFNATSYLKNAWSLLSSTGFLGSRFFDFAWIGLLFMLLPRKSFVDGGQSQEFIKRFVLTFFMSFILYVIIFSVFNSEYMRKHSIVMYGMMYKCVLYTMGFYFISEHIVPLVMQKLVINARYYQTVDASVKLSILFIVIVTSTSIIPYNIKDDLRERFAFISGKMQPKDVYLKYYPDIKVCDTSLTYLDNNNLGGKVWPIGASSSTSAYSQERFVDENDLGLQANIRQIFFSDPHYSIQAMRNFGISYFIIDFRESLRYLSMAPVFSPESLAQHFRVLTQIDDFTWLLTLNSDQGDPLSSEFISRYRQYLAAKAGVTEQSRYDGLATFLSGCEK